MFLPSVPLEILHVAFVLFGRRAGLEGAEIAALAGLRIDLAGIKPVLAGRKFAAQRGLSRRLNPQGSIRPPTARKPARRAVGTKVRGAFSPIEPRALRPLSRRCYRVAANRKGTRSCDGPTACGIARSQPGTTQRCAEPRTRSAQPFAARSISVRARQRCVCGANRSCSAPKWRLRV